MKPDDFCAQFQTRRAVDPVVSVDAARQFRVMAKQLSNGYPILPLPENIAALTSVLADEKAPKDTAADHPQG